MRLRVKARTGKFHYLKKVYYPGNTLDAPENFLERYPDRLEDASGIRKPASADVPAVADDKPDTPAIEESTEVEEQEESAASEKQEETEVELAAAKEDQDSSLRLKALGNNRWDVVNSITNEAINDAPLSKEEADYLLASK